MRGKKCQGLERREGRSRAIVGAAAPHVAFTDANEAPSDGKDGPVGRLGTLEEEEEQEEE